MPVFFVFLKLDSRKCNFFRLKWKKNNNFAFSNICANIAYRSVTFYKYEQQVGKCHVPKYSNEKCWFSFLEFFFFKSQKLRPKIRRTKWRKKLCKSDACHFMLTMQIMLTIYITNELVWIYDEGLLKNEWLLYNRITYN